MTVFEEKLVDFVLKGTPFLHIANSGIEVIGNNFYDTQILVLSGISATTIVVKPAFSEEWLFQYECVDNETANYVESVLHRILSKHRKNFKYL